MYYEIPIDAPGRLSIMPRPAASSLEADLRALRADGVDVLVSLLPKVQRLMARLGAEEQLAGQVGLEFHSYPIADFSVPDPARIEPFLDLLRARLDTGRHVLIHCLGGVGRSSLVAAALLTRYGSTPDEAWDTISTARGVRVPETRAQRAWPGLYTHRP